MAGSLSRSSATPALRGRFPREAAEGSVEVSGVRIGPTAVVGAGAGRQAPVTARPPGLFGYHDEAGQYHVVPLTPDNDPRKKPRRR